MKASELRIGNYLNGRKGPVTVTEIRENNRVKIKENPSNFTVGDCLLPIPLTEDLLLKLGFVKHGKYGYFYIDFFIVDLDMNGQFYMCDIDIHIVLKHVHQLQNLYFACTGEELTLEP